MPMPSRRRSFYSDVADAVRNSGANLADLVAAYRDHTASVAAMAGDRVQNRSGFYAPGSPEELASIASDRRIADWHAEESRRAAEVFKSLPPAQVYIDEPCFELAPAPAKE